MPGTLSVPERKPRSWPPPSIWATTTDVEPADAVGAEHLVPGEGHEVDVVLDDVGGHLADPLGGVGVEDHVAVVAEGADLGHLVDGADLVVGPHDGDEDGVVTHRLFDLLGGDHAVGGGAEDGDIEALLLEALDRVEGGLVLVGGGDDVPATGLAGRVLCIHLSSALDGEVVALGGAAGEDHFLGLRADQGGDLFAGGVNGFLGVPAELVVTRTGVAEDFREVGQHRFDHARVGAGRGGVVEVDREFQAHRWSRLRGLRLALCNSELESF